MDTLDVDARVFAEQVYARVEQAMVSEINQVVDTELQTFLSNLPQVFSGDLTRELQQGWLKDNYVKHVSEVVERSTKATWSFTPDVSLDQLPEEARPRAEQLYKSVDEAAVVKINAMVDSEFQKKVVSKLPSSTSSEVKNRC